MNDKKIKDYERKFREIMSPKKWHMIPHNKTFCMLLDESLDIMKKQNELIKKYDNIIEKAISNLYEKRMIEQNIKFK